MWYIVLLHVLGQGGVSAAAVPGSLSYGAAWGMLALAYVAVNCYALISGYVGCTSRFRLSKLVLLWLEVVSLNVAVWLAFRVFRPELAASVPFSDSFKPLLCGSYWYFTAYVGLAVISPVLSAVTTLAKKTFARMLVLMFAAFCVLPYIAGFDLFYTHAGYSMLWLVLLYLAGAYFRLHFVPKRRGLWCAAGAALYLACAVFMVVQKLIKENGLRLSGAENPVYLRQYSYTSPPVVLGAVGLFVCFALMQVKRKKLTALIGFFSASTFGVYILHTHSLVWNTVLAGRFAGFASKPVALVAVYSLAAAAGIFLVCALVEKLRALVFRLLCIEKLLKKIPFLDEK